MKTITIHGNPYVTVNERILYFRSEDQFKGFSLVTDIISHQDNVIIMRATVRNTEGVIIATGTASEKESDSNINKKSLIENCETSAWGRALANLGIGVEVAIASGDEMIKGKPDWWAKAVKFLQDGGTLEDIEKKYKMSTDLQTELMDDAASG